MPHPKSPSRFRRGWQAGMTMLEIIVVAAIISTFSVVAIPAALSSRRNAECAGQAGAAKLLNDTASRMALDGIRVPSELCDNAPGVIEFYVQQGYLNRDRIPDTDGLIPAECGRVWITVCQVNEAKGESPLLVNAGVAKTVPVNTEFNLADAAVHSQGETTYRWQVVSGPKPTFKPSGEVLNPSVTYSATGTSVLKLTAYDGHQRVSATVDVTVIPENVPPVADAGASKEGYANRAIELPDATATDPDNGPRPLEVLWSVKSGSAHFTPSYNSINPSVVFQSPGTYELELSVKDGKAESKSSMSVVVAEENRVPIVYAGAPKTGQFPTGEVAMTDAVAEDIDGSPLALRTQWTKVSGPADVTFDDVSSLRATARFAGPGMYVLQLSATDGLDTTSDTVNVLISLPPNQPPAIGAGAPKEITLPERTVSFADATASDPDNGPAPLTFSWVKVSGPGEVVFSNSEILNPEAEVSVVGDYVFELRGSDGHSASTSTVSVKLHPVPNIVPEVMAGFGQTIEMPVNTATLSDATAVDPDSGPSPLVYAWTQVSGPATAVFSSEKELNPQVTFPKPGDYVLRLTATDGEDRASSTVAITLKPQPNQPPVVNAGEGKEATLPEATVLFADASAADPDKAPEPLTYAWTQVSGPDGATFDDPTLLNASVTAVVPGAYVFSLSASDGALMTSATVEVTIHPKPNKAPVVSAGEPKTATLPNAVVTLLDATAIDDDNGPSPLTYLWEQVGGPGGSVFDVSTQLNPAVRFSEPGTYQLRLTAADGESTSSATVTIDILPAPNEVPVVDAGTDKALTLPSDQLAFADATALNPDDAPSPLTFNWTMTSGPAAVTMARRTSLNPTVTFTEPGTYVFRLTATDSSASADSEMTVVVSPAPNQAPLATAGSPRVVTLPFNEVPFYEASASDPDAGPSPLTFSWSQVSGNVLATLLNPDHLLATAVFEKPGVYTFQLTVSDGVASTSSTVTVTVEPEPNAAPLVYAGAPRAITLPINQLLLDDATASDPDGGPFDLTFTWSQLDGPVMAAFTDSTVLTPEITFDTAGVYVFQLSVYDGAITSSATVTVTVNPPANVPPIVSAGESLSITLPLDQATLSTAAVSDPDNGPWPLSYSWSQVSGPAAVSFNNSMALRPTATFPKVGEYQLQLTASDGEASASAIVWVVVYPAPNKAPVVNAGSAKETTLPQKKVTFSDATATDPDSGPSAMICTWSQLNGPEAVSFSSTSVLRPTVTFPASGTYTLLLSVSDGEATSTAPVVVTVHPKPNESPVVFAGSAKGIRLPTNQIALADAAASDPDDGPAPLSHHWQIVSGPAGATVSNPNELTPSASFPSAGTYVLQLTSADGEASVSSNVTVTVQPALNIAPTVHAGSGKTITLPQSQVALSDAVASDNDNGPSPLSYAWAQANGPVPAVFNSTTTRNPVVTCPVAGTYLLTLTVSDGEAAVSSSVTITVNPAPNQPPVVYAGSPKTIVKGQSSILMHDATATDPDNGPSGLTYSWTVHEREQANGHPIDFSDTTVLNPVVTAPKHIEAVLRLTVSDGASSSWSNVYLSVQKKGPNNDNKADAVVIPENGTVDVDLDGADVEPGEPVDSKSDGGTAWYVILPTNNGRISFSLSATDTNSIALFEGSTVNSPAHRGPDGSYDIKGGVLYYMRIGKGTNGNNATTVTSTFTPTPANDNFAGASELKLGQSATAPLGGANVEPGEPGDSRMADGTAWYWWQPPSSGDVTVTLSSSTTHNNLFVYTGTTLSDLVPVVSGPGTFSAVGGVKYFIQVGTAVPGDHSPIVGVSIVTAPSNDDFNDAIEIFPGQRVTVSLAAATKEKHEPGASETTGGGTAWYYLSVPTARAITYTVSGAGSDNSIVVYTGNNVGSLSVRSPGPGTFTAPGYVRCYFQVGRGNSIDGKFNLELYVEP